MSFASSSSRQGLCAVLAFLFLGLGAAMAQSKPDSSSLPYLVQEVCADPTGAALLIDPYNCPHDDTLRQLKIGEALPYHKHDQPGPEHPDGQQRKDSYPVRDINGDLLSINPFDSVPFDSFKSWHDGYGLYRVADGWVSSRGTKDTSGYSQTFYGADCKTYNGWVFFPLSALTPSGINPGQVEMPVHNEDWEQAGEDWPGKCPTTYGKVLTTWDFVSGYPFSGIGSSPVKHIDAIRVIFGLSKSPRFLTQGHLEIFYFTKLYGLTRWETWRPAGQTWRPGGRTLSAAQLHQEAARVAGACGNTADVEYQGTKFAVTGCRDWSAVSIAASPAPPIPWPVPYMNVLRNFHFGDGFTSWQHAGPSVPDADMQLSLKNSTTKRDTQFMKAGGQGVRYVVLSCAAECSPSANVLYQDVPVSARMTSGQYTFGAETRSENHDGTLRFAVTMLDGNGKVLGEKSFTGAVMASNGQFTPAESILLSSQFVHTTVQLTINPRTKVLRYSISPASNGTFDIVDTWLMKDSY
jgi:hypothetical protein